MGWRTQTLAVDCKPKRKALGVAGLACGFLLLGGCETGRTNKAHAEWQHLSDTTTTSKPDTGQPLPAGDHQPPVPGSPTASGPDGNQPMDDMQAGLRHGNEHGEAAAPHAQPANSPERH
jgi:hypothetical protein